MKKILNFTLKVLLIILLVALVLSLFKSCDKKPEFFLKLPDSDFTDFLNKLADIFPLDIIAIPDYDESGDFEDSDADDSNDDTNEDGGNNGSGDNSDKEDDDEHKCDEFLKYHSPVLPTCISTGKMNYFECTECGKFYDEDMNELTSADLIIPINPDRHDWNYISNEDGTHSKICRLNNSHQVSEEDCTEISVWRYNAEEHYKTCIYCLYVTQSEEHIRENEEDAFCSVCGYEFDGGSVAPDEDDIDGEIFGDPNEDNPQYQEFFADDDETQVLQMISFDVQYMRYTGNASQLNECILSYDEDESSLNLTVPNKIIAEIKLLFKTYEELENFRDNVTYEGENLETLLSEISYSEEGFTLTMILKYKNYGYDFIENISFVCEGLSLDNLRRFIIYLDGTNS